MPWQVAACCTSSPDGRVFSDDLIRSAQALLQFYEERHLRLATAESCTGGLVAALLTEIAGSSTVVECGFVTYSNEAKTSLLGVSRQTLEQFGAVSQETAQEMALGALAHSTADVAVAVTGIAGPSGATASKPVGLVHLAVARDKRVIESVRENYNGDRGRVRLAALTKALALLRAGAL